MFTTTALHQTMAKFENLSSEITQTESLLQETRSRAEHWQELTSEEFAQALSESDHLTEKIHTLQSETQTASAGISELLDTGNRQVDVARTNWLQEAATLRDAFSHLREQYQEMDAETAAAYDDLEREFQHLQERMESDQRALSDAVLEAENFLRNDFPQARQQAATAIAQRSEAFRSGLSQAVIPQVKDRLQSLIDHFQEAAHKLEQHCAEAGEHLQRQTVGAIQNYQNQQSQELAQILNQAQSLRRQAADWTATLSRANTDAQRQIDQLKDFSHNVQGPMEKVDNLLQEASEELHP